MPTTVKSYTVPKAKAKVEPSQIKRRDVGPEDVEIDIAWCGVCHSDLHIANEDWVEGDNKGSFPVTTGHEIVGKVAKVGDKVKDFKVGDKVGVGCLVGSCLKCNACKQDLENYCPEQVQTFGGKCPDGLQDVTQGGYSEKIVVNDHFVLHIPEKLYGPAAAPLLCAGITTFSPLHKAGIKKGMTVGVAGYGGLGHMGVKFSEAMGADTYILTTSQKKADDLAKVEGVKGAIVTTDKKELEKYKGKFDYILDTVPVGHDLHGYLSMLKPVNGHLHMVGSLNKCDFNSKDMLSGGKSMSGSMIGGLKETQEMLDFCAEKGITSDIEMTDFQHINEAWDRVQKNDVRFRFVIDIDSINK